MNPVPFVISRTLQAPRPQVWDAYTQPEQLKHWFGPKGVNMAHSDMDFRVGGTYHYRQALPDGGALWGLWTFREIEAPRRIVLLQHFSDEHGGVTRNPWNPSWPLQTLSTTTFDVQDGTTELTIEWAPLNASEPELATFQAGHGSMSAGWGSVLDRLEEYLSGLQR